MFVFCEDELESQERAWHPINVSDDDDDDEGRPACPASPLPPKPPTCKHTAARAAVGSLKAPVIQIPIVSGESCSSYWSLLSPQTQLRGHFSPEALLDTPALPGAPAALPGPCRGWWQPGPSAPAGFSWGGERVLRICAEGPAPGRPAWSARGDGTDGRGTSPHSSLVLQAKQPGVRTRKSVRRVKKGRSSLASVSVTAAG